jgi:F0F1-type ATP synthase alpha subunit
MEKLAIDKVLEFEEKLYSRLDTTHKKLNQDIIKKQALDDEIEL